MVCAWQNNRYGVHLPWTWNIVSASPRTKPNGHNAATHFTLDYYYIPTPSAGKPSIIQIGMFIILLVITILFVLFIITHICDDWSPRARVDWTSPWNAINSTLVSLLLEIIHRSRRKSVVLRGIRIFSCIGYHFPCNSVLTSRRSRHCEKKNIF